MQDVVAGKKRTRRRGGAGGLLGSDESDEDEDDEEARALRQRLAKKRRVEGDTLDALARDPVTAPFHATYQMALVDDANEFAHLDRDQELDPEPEPGQGRREGEGDDGDGSWDGDQGDGRRKRGSSRREELDSDEDEDVEMAESSTGTGKGKEEISTAEVRKKLQEVARGERVRIPLQYILPIFFEKQTDSLIGMSHARSGGRVVDGSRLAGGRRNRQVPRALIVLRHIHNQSAIPCYTPTPRCRRRHGRLLPRMSLSPPKPIIKPTFINFIEPNTRRRATGYCIRTTHETMGQRRRRCEPHPPWWSCRWW